MKRNIKILYLLLLTALVVPASSCLYDNGGGGGPKYPAGHSDVIFSVRVPAVARPATRALTEADESAVSTVDVFVFDSDGILRDSGYGYCIEDASTSEEVIKTFTVKLLRGANRDMMFLVNSREAVDAAYPDGVLAGTTTKAAFTSNVKMTLPAAGWNATSGTAGYRHIPMWGVKEGVTIDENLSLRGSGAVKVSRMVARVNVSLDEDVEGSTFRLTSAYLYNYNTQARVIPDRANGNWTADIPYATLPTVPAQQITEGPIHYPTMTTAGRSLVNTIYLFEAARGVPFGSAEGDFMKNTCLVIGGHYGGSDRETFYRVDFTLKDAQTGTVSYLDILRNHSYNITVKAVNGPGKDDREEAFNSVPENIATVIVRWNDQNMNNIVFDGVNMLAVSQSRFEFNREERAAVPGHDNNLTVTTDVKAVGSIPGGWTARVCNDLAGENILSDGGGANGWLRLTQYSGTGNYPDGNVIRLLADMNDSGADRTAYIHVKAGRMVFVVTVVQTTSGETYIEILDEENLPVSEFIFPLVGTVDRQFTVRWAPTASVLRTRVKEGCIERSQNINVPTALTPALLEYISGPGAQTWVVNPGDAYNPGSDLFLERSARIDFNLDTETGMLTKSLLLRQMDYNIRPEISDAYLMDGTTEHKILVKSNFPWKAEVVNDPLNVMQSFEVQYGGGNGYNEDYIKFRLINNLDDFDMAKLQAEVRFKFHQLIDGVWTPWTDHGTTTKEYVIPCLSAMAVGEANSYMMKPDGIVGGGIPIRIPLSIAVNSQVTDILGAGDNDLLLRADDAFTAEFVWTDNPNRIADNSSIRRLITTGSGSGGFLIVLQGSSPGNAVVAVRNSRTGNIVWSWHIWVTDYDPVTATPTPGSYDAANGSGKVYRYVNTNYDYVWMDRNLGAMTAAPGTIDVYGLIYQWGRKDPFPGPAALTGSTHRPIYDADRALTYNGTGIRNITSSIPANNLRNAIQNPKNYYFYAANMNDWYTGSNTQSAQNNFLWNLAAPDANGKTKTIFDPCPEGWRVPESHSTALAQSPWGGLGNPNATGNNGLYWDKIGYWPGAGYYYPGGSPFLAGLTGSFGYWWTASTTSLYAPRLYTAPTLPQDVGGAYRAYGFSVRCVRDYAN